MDNNNRIFKNIKNKDTLNISNDNKYFKKQISSTSNKLTKNYTINDILNYQNKTKLEKRDIINYLIFKNPEYSITKIKSKIKFLNKEYANIKSDLFQLKNN